MFCLHDKVVYPGHGVAHVHRIITKAVGDAEASFYELVFLNKDMTILVPVDGAEAVGLRPLSSHEHVLGVFSYLTKKEKAVEVQEFVPANWSKRNKEYQTKIKRGDLQELSEIYRDLHIIAEQKELSFGEKTLLQQIEGLLVEEMSLVEDIQEEQMTRHLRSLCSSHEEKIHEHQ